MSIDIRIERIPKPECEWWCDKGYVTHRVTFDIRATGTVEEIARGCSPCMQAFAEKVNGSVLGPTPPSTP